MTDGNGSEMVQLEGLWIEKGARLGYVDGARAEGAEDDDIKFAEEHSEVGKAHEKGLSRLWHFHLHHSHATSQSSDPAAVTHHDDERGFVRRRKVLEIITDMPGSHSAAGLRGSNGPRGLLAGVMGWDYLLGEMFGVDHISVGVEGMCLIPDCLARSVEGIENVEGGTKIDIREHGMGDVYFRRCVIPRSSQLYAGG